MTNLGSAPLLLSVTTLSGRLKQRVFPWLIAGRKMLGRGRLPEAIIIGAQKAGTTSLFAWLAQHPDVSPSLTKEVHYFDNHFSEGERWYRAHFVAGGLGLEASPYYLFHPLVPSRAAASVSAAKLIILLRNPVTRAYSHYQHELDKGRETFPFDQAIERESQRISDDAFKLARGEIEASFAHQHFSYASRGHYADQIERWMAAFPRESFLFIRAEDMFRTPQQVYDQVCDFLGLSPRNIAPTPKHQRSYPSLDEAVARRLADEFAQSNARLRQLTGIGWD